ncbi:MAG: hypothetical protein OXG34_15825 [bacterium]|nr:hypothetical protein [bacterium]
MASEHSDAGQFKAPVPSPPETTSTSRPTLLERIEERRRDPEFQERLKRNLNRHKEILDRLADC